LAERRSIPAEMALMVTLGLMAVAAVLLGLLVFLVSVHSKTQEAKRPPGPKPWPILGSLHLLGKSSSPFIAFTELAKLYGEIYSITLGSTPCIVVNSFPLFKEILIAKGSHFGNRPNFIRFHKLFGGDRNNCKYHTLHLSCHIRLPNFNILQSADQVAFVET
jgi:cytochrome P450 family 307 subfamily A